MVFSFFFFNDTATTEIYTLSLHDALPIFLSRAQDRAGGPGDRVGPRRHLPVGTADGRRPARQPAGRGGDRKSTRLNSSHSQISYAVFCLKKNKHWKFQRIDPYRFLSLLST